jgi:tetratricopeptide (TPR) repeat protein
VVGSWAVKLAEAGDVDRAIRLFEALQHAPPFYMDQEGIDKNILAGLYQHVGHHDVAVPLLEQLVVVLEAKYEAGIRHPTTLLELADVYARLGRDDEAIKMLQRAMKYNYHWAPWVVDGSMPWSIDVLTRLADDPRVIALSEENTAKREFMANRIRAMLAQHDVDDLLAPLLAHGEVRDDQ